MDITMPGGRNITSGNIRSWRKKPGDFIKSGDIIADITFNGDLFSDEISIELDSPVSGYIRDILVTEGQTVPKGTVIARIEL